MVVSNQLIHKPPVICGKVLAGLDGLPFRAGTLSATFGNILGTGVVLSGGGKEGIHPASSGLAAKTGERWAARLRANHWLTLWR